MPTVVLITTEFPYGKVEPFLETEVRYFEGCKVYIAPVAVKDDLRRAVENSNVLVLETPRLQKNTIVRKTAKLFQISLVLFNKSLYKELYTLYETGRINLKTLRALVVFLVDAQRNLNAIRTELSKVTNGNEPVVFYSYWMHTHAYVAAKLKEYYPKSKAITRCHRYDLYEERSKSNYIPMRKYILESMDAIHSISQDGLEYLRQKYPEVDNKLEISRLGSLDHGVWELTEDNIFRIVSCSWVVPVKRVGRIIDALMQLHDVRIEWTHFGDGALYECLCEKAKELPKNVKYNLPGKISNSDVLEYYKANQVNVFLNVSESEGIPVSIMEAISFGIPVIATDVGGVKEIVLDHHNGLLIKENFTTDELAEAIRSMVRMDKETYWSFRENARDSWNRKFNAEVNYKKFVSKLKQEWCEI